MPTVEYEQERKGFWHEPDGKPTSETLALEAWVREAHAVLTETAGTYHGTIGASRLAEQVMERSSIRTSRPPDRWMSKVLAPLSAYNQRNDEPLLASLVITGADSMEAARLRLECYRWAGSAPEDGGVPSPITSRTTRRAAPSRTRAAGTSSPREPRASRPPREPAAPRRPAASDRPVNVCPSCFMAIPATGVCDNCG